MAVHSLSVVTFLLLSLSHFTPSVVGHARLLYPPSRASMWRFGFQAPIDYNDNEGFCGGAAQLHESYNGKCGVCGDAWEPVPRAHEKGGNYYSGQVTATFKAGTVIPAVVHVTANHLGFFEFRVCPYDNPETGDLEMDAAGQMVEVSQTCLDKHLLAVENGQGTKLYLNSSRVGYYNASLRLPAGLHCNMCLFQWRYKTGNSWGTENGNSCIGCGKQEEFKACADVVIEAVDGASAVTTTTTTQDGGTSESATTDATDDTETDATDDTETDATETTTANPVTTTSSSTSPTTTSSSSTSPTTTSSSATSPTTTTSSSTSPTTTSSSATSPTTTSDASQPTTTAATGTPSCGPSPTYAKVPGMTEWCIVNCNAGYCPASHCVCKTS